MKTLIPILITLALSSCVTQKKCNERYPPKTIIEIQEKTTVRDSIVYKDRAVPVYIPGDTVYVEKYIPGIPEKVNTAPIVLENTYATAKAWIENSILKLQLMQKDQVIKYKLDSADRERYHWEQKWLNEKQTITLPPEKYTPKFWLVTGCLFIGLVLAGIAYIVFKFVKP